MDNDESRDEELEELAHIKDAAEDRLFRRIYLGLRIAKVVYALVAALILAAVWLYAEHARINALNSIVHQLWQQVYGYPLP